MVTFFKKTILAGCLTASLHSAAGIDHIELPALGDSISGIVSRQQEKTMGDAWLRMFRAQVRTVRDPLLFEYTQNLVRRLANFSELEDKHIELVIVDNPSINAFAVPGGVMGINNGLFINAPGEQEFASVVAHELAHLSQRHFARNIEQQQRQSMPTMAGMLAGLVIMAAGGGDAGLATLAATQAAAQQSALAHSRLHETEADRFGMDILVRADMDPEAMARMFETMLDAKRFSGNKYPEFLLTHPLTENRVSNAKTRARNFLKVDAEPSLAFFLMRSRVLNSFAESPQLAVKTFRAELANSFIEFEQDANRYGLVLSLIEAHQLDEAEQELRKLLQKAPLNTAYQLAAVDILNANNQHADAAKHLRGLLMMSPNSHPITMALGETYILNGQPKLAADLLELHSRKYPAQPSVWYDLAEAKGLAGDILGVHIARAEYFLLNGILDEAGRQLNYALNLAHGDFMQTAKLEQRMKFLEQLRQTKL